MRLNQLSRVELEERELKALVGGCNQACGCRSDNHANRDANSRGGYCVSGGECEDITYDGGYLDEVVVTP